MTTFEVTRKGRIALLAALFSIALAFAIATPRAGAATASTAPTTRIINGTVVPNVNSNWPYIVALVDESDFQFCGGTLIDASWVLTAAHCEQVPAIIIGRKKLSSGGGERILVDDQIVHPQYNPDTQANDLQLLHLAHPVTNPTPLALIDAVDDPAPGTTVSIAGWGVTESSGGYGVDDLREAQVEVFSNTSCNSVYGGIISSMLCASHFDPVDPDAGPNRDTCQGDSGGPLVANTPGGLRLAGITSWGQDCAYYPYPGVYTRVSSFKNWVLGLIGQKAGFTVPKVEFGTREIKGGSYGYTLTVKSMGILPVAVTGAQVTGSPEIWIAADSCTGAGSLTPGATCTIELNYSPTTVGIVNSTLNLTTDSSISPTEAISLRGAGMLPAIPLVLTTAKLNVAQSGKAKRLPHHKIKVIVKGFFPIPNREVGSKVCLSRSTLTGTASGKKIVAKGVLGWFGSRCSVSFALRLPAKSRGKKVGFDFHMDSNGVMAAGDKHVDVKIK